MDGWPRRAPKIISEYGFSAFAGRVESEIPSALLMADIVGQWLKLGGGAAYRFGYPPNSPATQSRVRWIRQHDAVSGDRQGQATSPCRAFSRRDLLTQRWTQPGDGPHRMIGAVVKGGRDHDVAAFALERPDGTG